MTEVWVFQGAGSRFANGVFATRPQAEDFIQRYQLSGILTHYPVGLNAYDWAIQEKLFEPSKPEHWEAGFIQRFTTASQEHYQYEEGHLG